MKDHDDLTIDRVLETVRPNARTILDISAAQDPGGQVIKKIDFSIEAKPPRRVESPKRCHSFLTAAALVEYLKHYGVVDTVVFVGPANIWAVLNENAAQQFELLTFTPQYHPIFKAWVEKLNRHMSVKDLAAFVQAQRQNIVEPKGALLAQQLRQVKASTKIELHQGAGNDALNGILISAKVQGKDVDRDVDLPEMLEVRTPIYLDTAEQDYAFDLNLQASPDGTMVQAVLTMPLLEVELFKQMDQYAREFMTQKIKTVRGTPAHLPWTYEEPVVL